MRVGKIDIDIKQLKKLIPLNSLSQSYIKETLQKAHIRDFPKKFKIISKGKLNSYCIYLLSGEVEILDSDSEIKTISAHSNESIHPLDQFKNVVSVTTKEPCRLLLIDTEHMELVVTWSQENMQLRGRSVWGNNDHYVVDSIHEQDEDDDIDWMSYLLQSHLFEKIPPAKIQQLFVSFEEVEVHKNEVIINQNDSGDCIYVIASGTAVISRLYSKKKQIKKIEKLKIGDIFGEDALIVGAKRNATVTMSTDGILMRLNEKDFQSLLKQPSIEFIDYQDGMEMHQDKSIKTIILDVRLPDEFKHNALPGSVNVPIVLLRRTLKTLSQNATYIMPGNAGKRGELAAFLLSEAGHNAYVLKPKK
ncbi:MAG: cyclic nucleotide-binding domain-containing protein [Gammaproteobacteria bacterium]|nr:cyclic nucleotide-binding domain-containing protein [Gammaproteobacteria bacterium]